MKAGGGKDEATEDAKRFGIELALPEEKTFSVLPQNWDIVMAFMAVQTQWRYAPSGHLTGLDYAAVRVAVKALGLKVKNVFAGLRVMEYEVLKLVSQGQ